MRLASGCAMKCLVLGGGGFIGSHVVDRLLDAGHDVRIFERPRVPRCSVRSPTDASSGSKAISRSATVVRPTLDGIDTVDFHLISTTLPKSSNDDPIFDVQSNVVVDDRLLRLRRRGGRPKKIVFISSGGTVYGNPATCRSRESSDRPEGFVRHRQAGDREVPGPCIRAMHGHQGFEHASRVSIRYGERQRVGG